MHCPVSDVRRWVAGDLGEGREPLQGPQGPRDIPEETYHFDRFPEYLKLKQNLEMLETTMMISKTKTNGKRKSNIRNPKKKGRIRACSVHEEGDLHYHRHMAKRVLRLSLDGRASDLTQKAVKSNFMLLLALGTNKPS